MSDFDDSDDSPKPSTPAGAPGWMATYADMMSLLLCFFILLLTQSEIDATKFKAIAGSLRMAFGVTKDIQFDEIPKGTVLINQQMGTCEQEFINDAISARMHSFAVRGRSEDEDEEVQKYKEILDQQSAEAQETFNRARDVLRKEIEAGQVEVVKNDRKVTIRIREQISFPSGSAKLQKKFGPTLLKVTKLIDDSQGGVAFAGHTDNVPIMSDLYRSNWDLSSARAVTLAHTILQIGRSIDPARVTVMGHGDTRPVVKNDTPENRERNRRVEIIIGPPIQ